MKIFIVMLVLLFVGCGTTSSIVVVKAHDDHRVVECRFDETRTAPETRSVIFGSAGTVRQINEIIAIGEPRGFDMKNYKRVRTTALHELIDACDKQ